MVELIDLVELIKFRELVKLIKLVELIEFIKLMLTKMASYVRRSPPPTWVDNNGKNILVISTIYVNKFRINC